MFKGVLRGRGNQDECAVGIGEGGGEDGPVKGPGLRGWSGRVRGQVSRVRRRREQGLYVRGRSEGGNNREALRRGRGWEVKTAKWGSQRPETKAETGTGKAVAGTFPPTQCLSQNSEP